MWSSIKILFIAEYLFDGVVTFSKKKNHLSLVICNPCKYLSFMTITVSFLSFSSLLIVCSPWQTIISSLTIIKPSFVVGSKINSIATPQECICYKSCWITTNIFPFFPNFFQKFKSVHLCPNLTTVRFLSISRNRGVLHVFNLINPYLTLNTSSA